MSVRVRTCERYARLRHQMWEMLELVRVYTKKKGQQPDFSEPIVLTRARGGYTVQAAIEQVGAPTTRRGYASRACVCVCAGG